jgi:hypothetical protein
MKSDSIVSDQRQRQKQFLKLHLEIAKKYRTSDNHFSHRKVGFIRQCYYRFGLNLKQTIKRVEEIMYRPHNKRTHAISWYLHLNSFLQSCSKETWIDINQPLEVPTVTADHLPE